MSDKIEYCALDYFHESMEARFLKFRHSETHKIIKQWLFGEIAIKYDDKLTALFNRFRLEFRSDNDRIYTRRKDYILALSGLYYESITNNYITSSRIVDELNRIYFLSENWYFCDLLCFHVFHILPGIYSCNIYIYEDIIRIAHIGQWNFLMESERPKYWIVQIDFTDILSKIYPNEDYKQISYNTYILSQIEIELLSKIRIPNYDLKNIKIDFDKDSIMEQITINWSENDLNRYMEIKDSIKYWNIWHNLHLNKKSKLLIQEIVNFRKDIEKENK